MKEKIKHIFGYIYLRFRLWLAYKIRIGFYEKGTRNGPWAKVLLNVQSDE